MFVFVIAAWLLLSCAIGMIANDRGRGLASWVFVAMLISPLLAYAWLVAIPDLKAREIQEQQNSKVIALLDSILMK